MLAAVGLAAALCGWFATAHNRSKMQDPVIASARGVWLDRWGPKWLDVAGADHLCRRIVGADLRIRKSESGMGRGEVDGPMIEALLEPLRRLPDLQYLFIEFVRPTLATAAALGDMRQLRMLSITFDELSPDMAGVLARALGGARQLRMLNLESGPYGLAEDEQMRIWHESLTVVGKVTSLESLRLNGGAGSLACLAALPHLKSLRLRLTDVTGADLTELASLESLEELEIDDAVSAAALDALVSVKRLKTLHLTPSYGRRGTLVDVALDHGDKLRVLADEAKDYRRALDALRRSHPGIVIDADDGGTAGFSREWPDLGMIPLIPKRYVRIPDFLTTSTLYVLREWKEGKDPFGRRLKSDQ